MVPLPNGNIDYVGVQIYSTAGVFGGGAYIADQTTARVVVGKDEKTGELRNGSVAVNVRWWFNGWSAVTYTLEVYALSNKQLPATTSIPVLTVPHCPVNKGALEALQKVNCFMITVGGDLDGNFNASNVGVGVAISCPNPPQPGPIVDWSCPPTGRAGEYVCLPDWTAIARVLGF